MFRLSTYPAVLALVILLFTPGAFAFGAGNIAGISKVKGVNWRHGDVEETALVALTMARCLPGDLMLALSPTTDHHH